MSIFVATKTGDMYEKKIPKDFSCGMAVMMEIIGGKWKSYLVFLIGQGVRRPSDIQRAVPSATRRVLNLQLRELEFHGIINRVIYPELPPKVEYYLTEFGTSILPVVEAMDNWGAGYLEIFRELMERKKSNLLMQAAETAVP